MDETVEISREWYELLLSVQENNRKCRTEGLSDLLEQIRALHPQAASVDEGLSLCSAAELTELVRGWEPSHYCHWFYPYQELLLTALKRLNALEQRALAEKSYTVEEVAAGE